MNPMHYFTCGRCPHYSVLEQSQAMIRPFALLHATDMQSTFLLAAANIPPLASFCALLDCPYLLPSEQDHHKV